MTSLHIYEISLIPFVFSYQNISWISYFWTARMFKLFLAISFLNSVQLYFSKGDLVITWRKNIRNIIYTSKKPVVIRKVANLLRSIASKIYSKIRRQKSVVIINTLDNTLPALSSGHLPWLSITYFLYKWWCF